MCVFWEHLEEGVVDLEELKETIKYYSISTLRRETFRTKKKQ